MEMQQCCDNTDCKIVQIMPPAQWVIYCGNPAEGNPVPLIGFALKECGLVIPLVHTGTFDIGELSERVWMESEHLYHPLYELDRIHDEEAGIRRPD